MSCLILIPLYAALGVLTAFIVLYIGYKNGWDEHDRNAAAILGMFLWPIMGILILVVWFSRILNNKAKELVGR